MAVTLPLGAFAQSNQASSADTADQTQAPSDNSGFGNLSQRLSPQADTSQSGRAKETENTAVATPEQSTAKVPKSTPAVATTKTDGAADTANTGSVQSRPAALG